MWGGRFVTVRPSISSGIMVMPQVNSDHKQKNTPFDVFFFEAAPFLNLHPQE
jgi:hypothetical protein